MESAVNGIGCRHITQRTLVRAKCISASSAVPTSIDQKRSVIVECQQRRSCGATITNMTKVRKGPQVIMPFRMMWSTNSLLRTHPRDAPAISTG